MTESAVAWLERDYDTAVFQPSRGYTPRGLFQIKRDHSPTCPCESRYWTYSRTAAKWTAGGAS